MIGFPKNKSDFLSFKKNFLNTQFQEAFENQTQFYLKNLDFFTTKQAYWTYFPFYQILNQDWQLTGLNSTAQTSEPLANMPKSLCIKIHNGKAYIDQNLTKDIQIYSYLDVISGKSQLDSKKIQQIVQTFKSKRSGFCSLNQLCSTEGLIIVFKKNSTCKLELQYLQQGITQNYNLNLRNFLFLEENSSAQILEVFYGEKNSANTFLNVQTDCFLEKKSHLDHARVDQMDSKNIFMNYMFAKLEDFSKAKFFSLSLQAQISRWHTELDQQNNSHSQIYGLSLLDKTKQADHRVIVTHKQGHSSSKQFYQSFLFNQAKQIFQSSLFINKDAQKSDSVQLSKNFLLGKQTFAVALPELDVHADDVKAKHGATVTSFTESKELLFYLQSRGLDSVTAFRLIFLSLLKNSFYDFDSQNNPILKTFVKNKLQDLKLDTQDFFNV